MTVSGAALYSARSRGGALPGTPPGRRPCFRLFARLNVAC